MTPLERNETVYFEGVGELPVNLGVGVECIDLDAIEMQNAMCAAGIPLVCEVLEFQWLGRTISAIHYDYGLLEGPELEWIDLQFIKLGYFPVGSMLYAPCEGQP